MEQKPGTQPKHECDENEEKLVLRLEDIDLKEVYSAQAGLKDVYSFRKR